MSWSTVPPLRVTARNTAPVRPDGEHVLYWMVAARRATFSFALERAADWARHLGRPLVILEALRCDYPWASDRLHRFVLDGMADNRRRCAGRGVAYHPYVEPEHGHGRGLLAALAERAAVVVTDDFPAFFLPRMVAATAARLPVLVETVDGNGLLPLAAAGVAHATAHAFRRTLQKTLRPHLAAVPLADPLAAGLPPGAAVPAAVAARWPAAGDEELAGRGLASLPIDHAVPVTATRGGTTTAESALAAFLDRHLEGYGERRNNPAEPASSGLSPYLHFGHLAAHQVVLEVLARERWSEDDLGRDTRGARSGWWGLSAGAETFLDQVVTWRELGFTYCHYRADHEAWSSLPAWAQATLEHHAADRREHLYELTTFAAAATHDPLWNAAQTQLRRDGTIHNYLRMLWGKKILEWSADPHQALAVMLELNHRWALDGRDPNSASGILWVLGRHDRAWGPERPVYGTVRFMSSASTARKLDVRPYLARYGGGVG